MSVATPSFPLVDIAFQRLDTDVGCIIQLGGFEF